MKVLRSVKKIIALVLTFTFIALVPVNTVAAANTGKYVSEVFVAYGKDAEAAKKTLSDKGFIPVEGNLNEDGKTYAMMGYKTTADPQQAITNLSVMNMNGGYSVTDYKHLLTQQKTNIANFLTGFMPAVKEYRANLKAGKARAVFVHDMLNKYTEDDSGKKLGDLFNSETLQDKLCITESVNAENPDKLPDLITLLMQGNTAVLHSVETLLAVSADSSEGTFLDRFASKSYDDLLDELSGRRYAADGIVLQGIHLGGHLLYRRLVVSPGTVRQEPDDEPGLGVVVEKRVEHEAGSPAVRAVTDKQRTVPDGRFQLRIAGGIDRRKGLYFILLPAGSAGGKGFGRHWQA